MTEDRSRVRRRPTTYPESFTPHVPGIQYGMLDQLVGYAVRRAQIAIYADFSWSIGDAVITPQRLASLMLIAENPGLQPIQLAEILGIARPGATAMIDFWQKRGAVERRSSAGDRRSYGIYMTPQGANVLQGLQKTIRAHEERITQNLSPEDVRTLMSMLGKIAETNLVKHG